MDNFCRSPVTPNTQGENENIILTSEKRNNLDALAETLKELQSMTLYIINQTQKNLNDAKDDPARNPRVATCTSDGTKRKVTDTSNRDLQQELLINRILPIITTMIDP